MLILWNHEIFPVKSQCIRIPSFFFTDKTAKIIRPQNVMEKVRFPVQYIDSHILWSNVSQQLLRITFFIHSLYQGIIVSYIFVAVAHYIPFNPRFH